MEQKDGGSFMTSDLRQRIAQTLVNDAIKTGRITALDRVVLVTCSGSGFMKMNAWKSLAEFECITNGESPDLIEQARVNLQAGAVRVVVIMGENEDGTFDESVIGEYKPDEKPTHN
jgi:hypothetical protein